MRRPGHYAAKLRSHLHLYGSHRSASSGHTAGRYYIIAILFVVFDVETIFLFPWAVKFKALGVFGFVEILIFLVILLVGYIWVWQKGALEWV